MKLCRRADDGKQLIAATRPFVGFEKQPLKSAAGAMREVRQSRARVWANGTEYAVPLRRRCQDADNFWGDRPNSDNLPKPVKSLTAAGRGSTSCLPF
jgi:hypothetical protein